MKAHEFYAHFIEQGDGSVLFKRLLDQASKAGEIIRTSRKSVVKYYKILHAKLREWRSQWSTVATNLRKRPEK